MLTPAWSQLRYHEQQSQLWRTTCPRVAVAAGRGSGKTELARRRVVRFLPVRKPWGNPMYFYALPTRQQAKRVAWQAIKDLVPHEWLKGEPNESDMIIRTKFGSELHVCGLDKPQRIEGTQWDGGIIDESCDQKPGHFDRSVSPALTHREGWCWRIGVPKRQGPGAQEFKAFFDRGLTGKHGIESYTWPSSSVLTESQLAWAMANLDNKDFNEQYNANWETASGLVFHAFSNANVSHNVAYNAKLPIIVGSDFNVDPMAWVLCHRIDNELFVFDELYIRNAHTQLALDALFLKYGLHLEGWEFYGDATGKARKTSAPDTTDYLLIRNDNRFKPKRISYPKSNPSVKSRFAATNALLCNAAGEVRLHISSKCKNLIADLKVRSYKEGTNDVDDYGDIGHITDALGYIVHRLFPIKFDMGDTRPEVYIG